MFHFSYLMESNIYKAASGIFNGGGYTGSTNKVVADAWNRYKQTGNFEDLQAANNALTGGKKFSDSQLQQIHQTHLDQNPGIFNQSSVDNSNNNNQHPQIHGAGAVSVGGNNGDDDWSTGEMIGAGLGAAAGLGALGYGGYKAYQYLKNRQR